MSDDVRASPDRSRQDPYLPEDDEPVDDKPAWGFRITLVLLGIYLVYRFVEMGVWLVEWIASR